MSDWSLEKNGSNCIIGTNIKILKFYGILLLPKSLSKKFLYFTLHIIVIAFVASEVVDMILVRSDLDALFANIKVTMLAILSFLKVMSLFAWKKDWFQIISYVIRVDKKWRLQADDIDKKTIDYHTKYAKVGTYIYVSMQVTTVVACTAMPAYLFFFSPGYRESVQNGTAHYIQVVSSWVPFDKDTVLGHFAASFYQSFSSFFGGGWTSSFDSLTMTYMVFVRGELKLLKRRCSKIFDCAPDQVHLRIKECHRRHLDLIRYSRLFDSCLSPIMFLYMIVCSLMLCASIYQMLADEEAKPLHRFLLAEYLVFGIAQLCLFCWHGNEVLVASDETLRGIYESGWWKSSLHRRELMLLTWQLDQKIIFSAGPFMKLTITTFINILKGAYSYYTFMSNAVK